MFVWKDEYSVGNVEIDNQHLKLFEIGNRIFELASLDNSFDYYDEIMQILLELKDYTIYHFGFEEQLMVKTDYQEYETHSVIHRFFIKKIEKLLSEDIDEDQTKTIINIMNFIADWIVNHILNDDMKYKEVINN